MKRKKKTPLALVLLYITYSWVLLKKTRLALVLLYITCSWVLLKKTRLALVLSYITYWWVLAKKTRLALVPLDITHSWVLLVQCAPRGILIVLMWLRFKSWSYAKRQFDHGSILAKKHQNEQSRRRQGRAPFGCHLSPAMDPTAEEIAAW